ncbi:MAG: type 1 glutamine amidotransferase [Prolixibacteraceae bacterium]
MEYEAMKKQLRIHYFQHEAFEGPGCIADWAGSRHHLLTGTRLYNREVPPDLSQIDWLIVMGGSMGVYDEAEYPWLHREKNCIREAVAAGKVIVGICLGAQLLAEALGAQVKRASHKEIGWFPVRKTPATKTSSLLEEMPERLTVFHWHGDQFDIPPGCFSLAESDACPNQAFQYGQRVIGLQFHFEATAGTISSMLEGAGEELEEPGPWVQTKSAVLSGLHHAGQNNAIMFSLLDKLGKS